MCVIICVENGEFPSKETLKSAESLNSHGGAIAWLNKDGTKSYRKGIKASKMWKLIQRQLAPNHVTTAIIHFRIASVGGVKPQLCHPFEITEEVTLNMKAVKTTKELLFHNGTWNEYTDALLGFLKVQKTPVQIPKGDYSDSRIMAYLAFQLGHTELNKLVDGWNKIAILTSEGIVKYGSGWVNHKGNSCSNDHFVEDRFSFSGFWGGSENGYSTIQAGADDYITLGDEAIKDKLRSVYRMDDHDIDDMLSYGYTLDDILCEKEEMQQDIWDEQDARCRNLD